MSAIATESKIFNVRVCIQWTRNLSYGDPQFDEERSAVREYEVEAECIEDAITEAEEMAREDANPLSRFDGSMSKLAVREASSWEITAEATHVDGKPVMAAVRA